MFNMLEALSELMQLLQQIAANHEATLQMTLEHRPLRASDFAAQNDALIERAREVAAELYNFEQMAQSEGGE